MALLLFRKTEKYHKKLMRLGAAMRRYGDKFSAQDNNFNSLSLEVDALEELSLSAFSLMKAIKAELADAAAKGPKSCINTPSRIP